MADEKKTMKLPHNLILEDRHSLSVTGVSDVESFDEQTVVVFTDMGELTVTGENLHINRLSVETGELSMQGDICGLNYSQNHARSGGFFSKIFK